MTYNPNDPFVVGREATLAASGRIYLAYNSGAGWANAITNDIGGLKNLTNPVLGGWAGQATLGAWGVDTVNHDVWAVLNNTGDFAVRVVPEPATFSLLALGGLAWFSRLGWRRSRARAER